MASDFQALKDLVDIGGYIQKRTNQAVKNVGDSTLNLYECPFCGGHDCFRIFKSEKNFKCFQCENGGDIFDFIECLNNCDKAEALQILAKEQGYELSVKPIEQEFQVNAEEEAWREKYGIFEAAANYYHNILLHNNRARGYQKKVRCHSDDTLKTFRVGYSDGRLYEHLKKQGYSDEQCLSSGLVKIRKGKITDFFFHDLFTYPHLDKKGRVCGFTIKDKEKKYKYRLAGEHWGPGCSFYNMQVFDEDEVFLVEGENDLLSVYGHGGYKNVAAINGQINQEQLEYLYDWLSDAEKTLYLCFDNDKAGRSYCERVCNAVKSVCLPDTLAKLLNVKAGNVQIVRYDPEVKDIDDYLRTHKSPRAALHSLIKGSERYFQPLLELKSLYLHWVADGEGRKFNNDTYGKICFEWFQAGGKFFIDGEECFLYFRNTIYKIGVNAPFKAFMYDLAEVNAASNGARLVIQAIESLCYLKGDKTAVPGWIFTNFKENTVYFNLCGEFNNLLKIGPGKIEVVPNGTNTERVLLRNSPKMHPIRFIADADVKKGMASLKKNIFDNLACDITERYFVICLLINVVLLQYVKARGITKFSGTKGCGKTSAASMLSAIIYGEDCVTTGSAASDFSEAAVSPLTISDNLESDAVKGGKRDFLLTAATGITRQKRKAGSDSDNVYERSCTQLLVTSIEPFVEPELIERTNEILYDKKFHNPDFKESITVENDVKEARDLIWSSIFKIVAYDILPGIEEKKAYALKMIRNDYKSHSKSRLNELYAMLYIILGEVVKYFTQPGPESEPAEARLILQSWITTQNKRAFATEEDSNMILYGLEDLYMEYEYFRDSFEREYGIQVKVMRDYNREPTEVTLIASTKTLHMAFNRLAKDRGIQNQFRSPSQLGARINDSIGVLKKAGWTFEHNATAYRGERRHKLTRKFEETT